MIDDKHISLAHGNGGRFMRALIEDIFVRHLGADNLDAGLDAAAMPLPDDTVPLITTDGFTVQPLEFPGGTIGSLAVNGTVNDIAVSGGTALYLTLGAMIEEGLEVAQLDRIVSDLADAARQANVKVIAGDTKVVPRGQGGGLYLTATGVGVRPLKQSLGYKAIRPGDRLLVSGPVGDHGIAVMLARQDYELSGNVVSDCAAVTPLTAPIANLVGLRFMRDPTRGGLATVAHEIAAATGLGLRLREKLVPVRDPVRSVCDMLGYDPYYLACEGRVLAIVSPDIAGDVLAQWHRLPQGAQACEIGTIETGRARVILETVIGGERILEELEDDPLPRIC